jgi:hypothetical protein
MRYRLDDRRTGGKMPSGRKYVCPRPGQGRCLFPDSKLLRFFLDFVDGAFVLAVYDVARLVDRLRRWSEERDKSALPSRTLRRTRGP